MTSSGPPQKSRAELIREMQAQTSPLKSATTARGRTPEEVLSSRLADAVQWQYAVINLGTFNSADRMQRVLGLAGEDGWELVAVYDKASNWLSGLEKGFMLFKRPVPEDIRPGFWCVST
jgi:hypothetical protein